MAKDKKSFVAYCDWLETFEELTDEEAGKLVKHLFRYVNDKNPEAPDRLTKMCFIEFKRTLKRDLKKYEGYLEKQRENGKRGGRPKKPKKPNPLNENPTEPKKADSVNDNVNDNDTVSDNETKEKHRLILWIEENAPRVQKLTNPITNEQAERIKTEFDKEFIIELFEQMHNYKNLTKNYIDANKTFRSWAKRDGRYEKWLADNGRVKIDMNLG